MIPTAIIIFREIFEIAILISIISVATNKLVNRRKIIFIGILIGMLIGGMIGLLVIQFHALFNDFGQEILSIIILSISISLISYTVIWMNKNFKSLSQKLSNAGDQVISGSKPYFLISMMISFLISREFSEIILFLSGLFASGTSIYEMIKGIFLGLFCGVIIAISVYQGFIRVYYKYIFKITTWILIFLAATMASELANLLSSINVITIGNHYLWNSSGFISDTSLVGKVLHIVFGYDSRPTIIQLIFYLTTITFIYLNVFFKRNT